MRRMTSKPINAASMKTYRLVSRSILGTGYSFL
jgi:hypothetical protein